MESLVSLELDFPHASSARFFLVNCLESSLWQRLPGPFLCTQIYLRTRSILPPSRCWYAILLLLFQGFHVVTVQHSDCWNRSFVVYMYSHIFVSVTYSVIYTTIKGYQGRVLYFHLHSKLLWEERVLNIVYFKPCKGFVQNHKRFCKGQMWFESAYKAHSKRPCSGKRILKTLQLNYGNLRKGSLNWMNNWSSPR